MLINKHKKAGINVRLLLMLQLRNFQMREIVSNIFHFATKHIFIFVSRFTCFLNTVQHEYESITTEAAQNVVADGKYFQPYQ